MPDARPIDPADRDAILAALEAREASQTAVEKAVARALLNGASVRAVTEATRIAKNTVMIYGRAHGWPTAENRANFNATRWDRARMAEEQAEREADR